LWKAIAKSHSPAYVLAQFPPLQKRGAAALMWVSKQNLYSKKKKKKIPVNFKSYGKTKLIK
jgi:hypothetical protein